jgi:hypothetical protein
MKIYILTKGTNKWAYTSAPAMLMHGENPLDISSKEFFEIEKAKGYPIEHSGCTINVIEALSMKEVRSDNPANPEL